MPNYWISRGKLKNLKNEAMENGENYRVEGTAKIE
jgi:hypothetical protein